MFAVRIVTTDHYQGPPIPGLDVQFADFRASIVKKVPVIRVFGSTPQGQKTCMHVHGVFPYLYVLYDGTQPWDRYLRLFANSLDKAINVAQGNASAETQHVYKINMVSGIPMYGFYEREQQFLKIYFYNPNIIRRAADLLLGGAVLNKGFQPHESHIPYTLQMFIDYNLYGMNMLNVAAVKFRRKAQDENANPNDPESLHHSDPTTPTSPDGSLQDWLNNASLSPSQPLWNSDTISRDMYLGSDVLRQSTCELEVDVVAADILNRQEVDANVGNNPGLAALWEDERQRKRNVGQSSQITPPASQERVSVEISDSDQALSDRFREIVLSQLPYLDSQSDSISESSQEDIIPSQAASSVDLHSTQNEDVEDVEASQSTVILEEEEEEDRAAIVNMDSIHRVVSMSQHFSATPLSQQSDEPQDRSLAALLASLADDSSPPATQAAAGEVTTLEEKDSILLDAAVVPDDETTEKDEAETLEMSQVVWEDGSQDSGEGRQRKCEKFDLEGLDTTWNDSQAVPVSDEEGDTIPQFDGANDEKPHPAKKSKKKRLGTTGPVVSGFDKTPPSVGLISQSGPFSPEFSNPPQGLYGPNSNQYPSGNQYDFQGQGYGMEFGTYSYSQWNPQGSYGADLQQGFGMQTWGQQTPWNSSNPSTQQQCPPEGQGLPSPQGQLQPRLQGSHRNLPQSQNMSNSPRSQHSPQGLQSPHGLASPHSLTSPHGLTSPNSLSSPQGLPSPHGNTQGSTQLQKTSVNSPVPLNIGAPMLTLSRRTMVQGHGQNQGQGYPPSVMESRDSFSALMNDETLSNNLWNFSEFGGISDSDGMLSQGEGSMGGQIGTVDKAMEQMYYPQNQPNFLSQGSHSMTSSQGHLTQFPSGQPGMTSTPVGGSQNSQESKTQQGVNSNCSQIFPRLGIQPSSQTFSNSQSGTSQGHYPEFSGYSQQEGFSQHNYSNTLSSSYSKYSSQTSPKNSTLSVNECGLTSTPLDTSQDSAMSNRSYSAQEALSSKSRLSAEARDFNTQQYHMPSGGNFSGDSDGSQQNSSFSSHASSQFSNSQPLYQSGSLSHVSDSQRSDNASSSFSPHSHSYKGPQPSGQCYNSQPNLSTPHWGPHMSTINDNPTTTVKKRSSKKKENGGTTTATTKKKATPKKSTKKSSNEGPKPPLDSPNQSSLGSMLQASSLGSVLKKSNSFQPRGVPYSGGNLLEKLLLANEEEGSKLSKPEPSVPPSKSLSSPGSLLHTSTDSTSPKSGSSSSSQPFSDKSETSRGPTTNINFSYQNSSGPYQTNLGPKKPSGLNQAPSGLNQNSPGPPQTLQGPHEPSGPHLTSSGPNQNTLRTYQHPLGPLQTPVSLPGSHQPSGYHQKSTGPKVLLPGPHILPSGSHQSSGGPQGIPPVPYEGLSSSSYDNKPCYLSPFRENTPDKDRQPQTTASHSVGSLFSLQNLVSNVSQKTKFGQSVRQIATDGKPYSCSESELRSYIQKNLGPVEASDSVDELGKSVDCEVPIRKPTNVSELIRSKVELESRKKRSTSASETPNQGRRHSVPSVSENRPMNSGQTNPGSISHPSYPSTADGAVSSNCSRGSVTSVDSFIRDKLSSDSSQPGHQPLPNSVCRERNKSFSSSSSGVSASSNEIVSRERTMSTSSVNNNRTEFSCSLKQKSVNRPSIVRSFSTPNPQKIIQPVKRKRGRPRKTEVTPVAVQPTKYTYRFTVPAPAHKHLQFIELSHQSPRKRVQYVHMHPMDARRYSLLKIGREVVRLKKLSVKQLGKLGRSDSPQEAEPCVRDNPQQAEPCVRDNPQQAELCAESCVQAVKRGNTMPFVSEKKAYPSYEELREEVAKSKGATKLVAESEKPFAELWCVEDKTSGPQQIEKITLASIIDKAFSSMDTDEDCVGDGRRLGEDSVSNRKAQNQRASDDKGLQSRKEDRLNLLEPTSKYQGQFYKYLQRNSDAPNPVDNRTMEQLGYSPKMACSKAVQHKKKPNPHKKLPLVVDPNGEDLPDPVLQDVSLMKASRGSSIPVQSQTPVTGRSPFMHQSVPDPCQLLNSDVLDPRIKSSSKDYEHSIHEQEETDTQGGSKMKESIEKDKGRDKGWELESVTQRREDVGLMESQSSLDSQPSSASKSDSSQMDQDISDQIPTLTKEIECRTDLLDDIGRNSSTAKSSENLSLIKSNLSCPKLSVSDFTETKQPQSSKSVLNLSGNQNTPTIPQNSEKCVESLGESEGGPPSNTGSDLENMLPLSENKSEPETQSRNTCVFEGHKFEGHMTRSRSSSESNSRWQTNEDGVKKNHSETDVEKTRKSVRISRESRKRKREIPGVDYFVTGKFKGHKRMTVQLNKLNISNGTVVKLSQVFSLNSLYQKNGSNHKTVQAPEMAAHEPFCDNIFEKFKSFQDSKFFGNIVSDDSSKDSTYFQPRKSRLSLLKRGRPNDEVIEISSSEDEGRGKKVTTATEKEWGMNDSVICVEEDEYDDEMEDEKESDENSLSKTVKPSQKFIKKKKKTNKCRKIHTAFNGASYRTRKRRTRSCSGKLMTSLSVLHQATLANLIDSPLSYCESTDDYRTKYDDALFSMSLYSPPPPDELEKSPPRAQSPSDLKDIAGSPEITNVFSDLCKAMMSDDESRSPVYSPVKTKRSVLVRLNESPLKIPLGDSFEEPEIGSEKIQKGRVSVLNIHDVKRQGNDDKAKESSGYNNVGSGHHLDRSMEPVLDEPLRDEEHGAHSSDTDRDNHRTEQNTGPRLGPLHIKRKAIVRLRPLTDREIQSYCLNPAGAGKENIPVVSERESVSPPDLGPPIIPKFGKDLKQELECPPRLIRSDSYIDLYEDEAPGCLDPGSAREQDLVTSNDKFSEVYHAKKLAQKDHSRKVKGSKEESVPNSGSSETSPGGLSPTKLGAGKKTEGGHQEKTTLPRRRRPSQQGGGGERIPHSLTPTKRQVLKPKHPPPSRLRVEGTAKQYGLQCVVNQDAFCSNANDVPEKPREVGGRVLTLQNNRVTSFLEYLSTVTGEGLAAFRQILAATDRILPSQTDNQTVMDSITRDHNLRCSLLGDRRVTMVPCKLPPSQAKVRLWLEKKELYRKQRRKEKAQKQQQCNPQENQQSNLQKNQFTKIVPLIHYSQIKDKDTVRTPKTKLITKEVSFNETAEIFNMEDEVSPGEKNGGSCDKEGTELSMEEKSGSGMSSQESGDDIIGPSPPQQTCCSFRREEEEVISPSPPQLTHHSFRRDTGNIISPSPSKLTMPSVRRNSQQSGKSLTSKSRPSQLSSEEKKQSCDAVRRNLIGSVHSTPVSSRDQRSLLETINVTPISHSTDNDPENPRKRLETPGVFLTPKRVPLPSKESVEKGDPRRLLMSSADMREMATPTNSKGNQSQIDGPTPKNSFGFKVSQHDFQKAKALHEVQNLTVMSLELHAETRRDLMPDPEVDPILAVFYNILNDVTIDAQQRDITGVILVDKKSKEIQSAIKNRKKSTQPDPPSPQPSTSRDTWSEVKPSPQPSTSRPLSPQPSTSRAPTQRGKRPRSVSPTPSPGAKIPRGEAEHTLLQKSGVDDLEVVYVENEEELFMEVLKLFSRWDPDILVGFEIQKFSWGYLLQRASQLSVNLCAQMSRIPDEKKKSSFKAESDEWGSDHSSEIHIAGRVILNLWRIIRHEVTLNIYTFENVAHHVIHQRVPHFSLQTLNSWFKHRTHLYRWRFIKYYLTRVQGNLKVIDQLDLIGRTSEFARVFGIEFYHVLSRGSQYRVESMMLRLAKPMNFIPASPSVQQRARMRAPECIALTLEPESRFYADPVVVVDFQSLYPSIMIAHNYCFSTCVGRLDLLEKAHEGPFEFGCAHLRISPKTLNRIKNDVTVSPNGVVFVKEHIRKGIISKMVEEILNTRIMVKKSMKEHKNDKGLHRLLDARQLGLKLIANVTYGYTAASFSGRMPCVEVADSIVRKARETLERAIKLVEERPEWGARVVYGDTDSMFIEMKGRSKEEAFRIGHEICDAVTAMNPQPIKLKFEKVYYPCVLQTKKRYVGYSYETLDQKEPVFDAKGIETVRRDSCAAVSKILERSIKILFGCKDVSKVKEYVLRQCRKFMEGKVSMQDCVFAKEYRGMKGYKPGACVPALEIAKKLLRHDRRSEPRTGERVPYVIIYGSPGLPLIQLVRQPGEVLSDPALRLNATYYITKQILPPLDRVFSLLGVDVFSWYNDMPKVVRVVPQSLMAPDQRKGTISQYFSATNCPVCDKQTNQPICNSCVKDPQHVCVTLCDRIRRWEKVYHDLVQVCNTCMGVKDESQPCVSLDCPIMFRRVLAKQDVQKGTQLREVVNKVLDF